jgi:formate/nitrite transporter FocA (FNT family)
VTFSPFVGNAVLKKLFLSSNQQENINSWNNTKTSTKKPENLFSSLAVSQSLKEKKIEKDSLSPFLLSINYSVLFLFSFFFNFCCQSKSSQRERKGLKKSFISPFSFGLLIIRFFFLFGFLSVKSVREEKD